MKGAIINKRNLADAVLNYKFDVAKCLLNNGIKVTSDILKLACTNNKKIIPLLICYGAPKNTLSKVNLPHTKKLAEYYYEPTKLSKCINYFKSFWEKF